MQNFMYSCQIHYRKFAAEGPEKAAAGPRAVSRRGGRNAMSVPSMNATVFARQQTMILNADEFLVGDDPF